MVSVAVAMERVRVPLSQSRVAAVVRGVLRAEKVSEAMVSIAFVSRRRIAQLNRQYLGHAGATDVISFAFGDPLVGDIYICPDVARGAGVPLREELTRLVVHGVLHVVGHEHPDGDERMASPMWRRQETLVRRAMAAR
jgi:probable rRNA maturation factor